MGHQERFSPQRYRKHLDRIERERRRFNGRNTQWPKHCGAFSAALEVPCVELTVQDVGRRHEPPRGMLSVSHSTVQPTLSPTGVTTFNKPDRSIDSISEVGVCSIWRGSIKSVSQRRLNSISQQQQLDQRNNEVPRPLRHRPLSRRRCAHSRRDR